VDLGLRDTVCVVTGSTGGIGLETAKLLAAEGARVVTSGRSGGAPGVGEALHVLADLARAGEPERLVDKAEAELGRVDVLVNNVGAAYQRTFEEVTDAQWDELWQLNVMSYVRAIRAVLPGMKQRKAGVIVNVSSTSAFTGVGSNIAYVASKAGLDVMGKALARVMAPQVRVLTVSPGAVDSSFVPGRGADFNAKVAAATPLKRVGLPEDVAAAIEACATTLRFATGQVIVVDGGRALS